MVKFKADLQIRGEDWGVSIGAGKVAGMDDDLGDGKTPRFLIENGCVNPDHYEELESVVPAWTPPHDESEQDEE